MAQFPEDACSRATGNASSLQLLNQESFMNEAKKFASQADLEEKQVSFTKFSEHA